MVHSESGVAHNAWLPSDSRCHDQVAFLGPVTHDFGALDIRYASGLRRSMMKQGAYRKRFRGDPGE
jgi:hypothetical protein